MRTTITIPEDLLRKARKLSGLSGYSEAIVTSLSDYVAMKERLAGLKMLFTEKTSHVFRQIKKQRKARKWSS